MVQTKGTATVEVLALMRHGPSHGGQVVASLVYDKMEISTEDPNVPIGATHTAPAVKLVRGTADRTLCQSTTFDVPVGLDAQNVAAGTLRGADIEL